ncbi:MAG: BrnT family toxin [Candidatus Brocadiales bacterium]|nr:BrnT family toxin [Candidatus Brocadiales bacterium]
MPLIFEWDKRKAGINKKKHNVSFEEASTVFSDTLSITIPDPLHSVEEDRFITIGNSFSNKLVIVVHTDRGKTIRIINARSATKQERKQYEEGY